METKVIFEIRKKGDKGSSSSSNSPADNIAKSLEKTFSRLGLGKMLSGAGKVASAAGGAASGGAGAAGSIAAGVAGGLVAGGVVALLDTLVSTLMDFPMIAAVMRIFKLILMLLLLPLIPILKPALMVLAKMASFFASDMGQSIISFLWKVFIPIIGALLMFFEWFENGGMEVLAQLWETIKKWAAWAWDTLVAGWNFLADIGKWVWNSVIVPAFSFLVDVGMWIWEQILKPAFDVLLNVGTWIWDTFIVPGWTAVLDFGTRIWDTFIAPAWGVVKSGFTSVKTAISGVLNWINNILKKLGLPGIGGSSVNDAIIAPGGKIITTHPEDYLIATKDPGKLMGGGGGGLTINVNNPVVRSEQDIDEIVRRLSRIIQVQQRGHVSYGNG